MLMRSTDLKHQDLQACIDMMRGGSKSFFAASKLLPERVRNAAVALYAFCRVADDLVDEGESSEDALLELRQRLDGIYSGQPQPFLEDNALAHVAQQYALPRNMLEALIEGFEWDAQGKTYETIEDVHQYAARVAGSVGAMMCWIMGPRHAGALARACELGVPVMSVKMPALADFICHKHGCVKLVWIPQFGCKTLSTVQPCNRLSSVCWMRLTGSMPKPIKVLPNCPATAVPPSWLPDSSMPKLATNCDAKAATR
jgi:hypothetical protein